MKIINKSILPTLEIEAMVKGYPFTIETVKEDKTVEIEGGYPFADDSQTIYISDDCFDPYKGLTYPNGAVSVYDTAGTFARLGFNKGWICVKLRILHEVLHHFDMPADNMEEWLSTRALLNKLYHLCRKPNGETYPGMFFQMMFYNALYKHINEASYAKKYNLEQRDFRGVLKN